jgi:hypothetical protein
MTKTAEEIRQELKKRRSKKGKYEWHKIKAGVKEYWRIGPPWKKGGEFWKDVLFHGGYKDKVYCRKNDINPKTDKPRKCPVCIRLAELKTDRSTFGKKLWSLINQRSEGLWNILVAKKIKRLESGKVIVRRYEHDKFQIQRLSSKWQAMMMDIFGDEDYRAKSILGVTHPKYGRLIKASRVGSGRDDTIYTFTPTDHVTPIFKSKEKRIAILKTLIDLDALIHGSSQEECEAFVEKAEKKARKLARLEKEVESDDEDEDDDEPKKRHHDEDEEEDEEEADEDDDDLEKNYQKVKKKLKKKKALRQEEDDEDEDDDYGE